ncbi:hypothetical protein FJT64_025567 [Amphibalanus amphitrite]|uniref:Uncharacterized protein n=1 Tax=Amphibalanus amphitrite TaxID=1232801 RepID=A0A6A4W2X7_AMPAM|nr:hypothetical protein FJT64_025567 [Amphibalanus amphitrite]
MKSVLQSLEQLHTQLSEVDVDYDEVESLSEGHKTALYASVALVKQMLSETQTKFYSMMEDNQILGSRIDGNLQVAQSQVTDLRSELADTHRMIDQIAAAAGSGDRLRPTPSQERAARAAGSRTSSPAPATEPTRSEGSTISPERTAAPAAADTGDLSEEDITYYDKEVACVMCSPMGCVYRRATAA